MVLYAMPPKDFRKIWRLLKSSVKFVTRVVFATDVEEGLNDHSLQRNAVVLCIRARCWKQLVHWGDHFIFGIPDDRADDLERLMREVFKVKVCERIALVF